MRAEQKKGLPGGFFLLIFAATVLFFGVQSLTSDKEARVSFSHQVEHLTNLHLTVPDENHKIAQNEHLVTFGGKFSERLPDESMTRYRYLELLNQNHELKNESARLELETDSLGKSVREASSLYLAVSNQTISRSGYVVVGSQFDTTDRSSAVIVKEIAPVNVSLSSAYRMIDLAKAAPSVDSADVAFKELRELIVLLRSPALGIGNEGLKTELKTLDQQLLSGTYLPIEQQIALYETIAGRVNSLLSYLGSEHDGIRLSALRSVRSYVDEFQQYSKVSSELEKNVTQLDKARQKVSSVIWYFNNQEMSTRNLEKQDADTFGFWFAQARQEWENFDFNKGLTYRAPDQPRNTVLEKTFKSQEPSPNYFSVVLTLLPVVMVILFLYFIFSKQMKGAGSSAMNFGKSPARLMTKDTNKVTFRDVAGADEAKEELKEVVDFLKDPQKFTALGARIPKGVLLVGSPGTGKTLIAKAVAGEADRPFFSISGSDFVEMFVGVGASRIRDMFAEARKNAPCIIFMDEIDAVGRHRGSGVGGGHDEREQTLNQLLVEMDGFDTREGVILIAATNRPDVLDKALLRPGRFDRRVVLELPDVKGRFEILKVHARKIKIDPSVNLNDIARNTPGASGADLENILNESALLAARRGRSCVTSAEVKEACDKVRYGKERRSLEMDQTEKKTTAYHETGHAIVSLLVKNSDPVDKVTIIPRGFSLGATHFMPKKNRLSYWKKEITDQLAVLMGGRAAEELFVGDMSSGAQHDILQATKIARSMVCEWGMSDNLGTVTYDERSEGGQYLGQSSYQERGYSDETAQKIDKEVKTLIDAAHKQALDLLESHKVQVQLMTDMLMEFESLDAVDVKEIMEGSWNVETKRARVKTADELQKIIPPVLPPIPVIQKDDGIAPELG